MNCNILYTNLYERIKLVENVNQHNYIFIPWIVFLLLRYNDEFHSYGFKENVNKKKKW